MQKPDPVVLLFLTGSSPNHHQSSFCDDVLYQHANPLRTICSREILLFYFLNFKIRCVRFTTTAGRFFGGKKNWSKSTIRLSHHMRCSGLVRIGANLLFDSWLWLVSHQVPRRKNFEFIIILIISYCSNKVNSVNVIVISVSCDAKKWWSLASCCQELSDSR